MPRVYEVVVLHDVRMRIILSFWLNFICLREANYHSYKHENDVIQ